MSTIDFLLLPACCVACGQAAHRNRDLCLACERDLPFLATACERCAIPLQAESSQCGACLRKAPPQQRAFSPFRYEFPLSNLIQSFKFEKNQAVGRVLGELFAENLRITRLPDALLPVPLHPERLRERGFNQAELLASAISTRFGIPVRNDLVVRRRNTNVQSGMNAVDRQRNMRGAFELHITTVPREVAIIDDVMTTGSTIVEMAARLRKAGVEHVEAWTLARTP